VSLPVGVLRVSRRVDSDAHSHADVSRTPDGHAAPHSAAHRHADPAAHRAADAHADAHRGAPATVCDAHQVYASKQELRTVVTSALHSLQKRVDTILGFFRAPDLHHLAV